MANPVLIAKLALVAADPKTWQKIIIACISIFIISAALLGSCGAMTFTDLGFDCSQLFSAKLNEYSAVFDSGARINDIHNAPQLQPEPEPETKSNPISNPGGFWS